ncbi:MAG TPA: hypothetical protein ENN25_02905 [Euryarchaeota archaeon]|nr:hypothetical protein [Euryarchaeota archaeon]
MMYSDAEEMVREIKKLREELNQMREIVNMLLNVVMEESEEDEFEQALLQDDSAKRFNLYN